MTLALRQTSLKSVKPLCLEVGFEQHFVINNTSHLLLDDGLVPIASTTKTIFPKSTMRLFHKAYFDARALILFSLELVFWTADPTRIKMMKSWFGDAGSWKRALMGSLFCLQAFVIISFPVVVHTHNSYGWYQPQGSCINRLCGYICVLHQPSIYHQRYRKCRPCSLRW